VPPVVYSSSQKETDFTPVLQRDIEPGKNLVYCVAFQAAWNEFCDTVVHDPVVIEGDPLLVRLLNKRFSGNGDLPRGTCITDAGFEKDGVIRRLEVVFKDTFRSDIPGGISLVNPEDILIYAYMRKEVSFSIEFESLPRAILFNYDTPVKAFGIQRFTFDEPHQDLAAQVEVFSFNSDVDFIIRLKSLSAEDDVILAKVPPLQTLGETVNRVLVRMANNPYPTALFEGETVQIPRFDFDVIHCFTELMANPLLNKGFDEKYISLAVQSIRFTMNERGALLATETPKAVKEPVTLESATRRLVFDAPFLILLKQKKNHDPYFAIWVGNTELMLKE
jgi:hypothetical protein